jgi:hypothetical protein
MSETLRSLRSSTRAPGLEVAVEDTPSFAEPGGGDELLEVAVPLMRSMVK